MEKCSSQASILMEKCKMESDSLEKVWLTQFIRLKKCKILSRQLNLGKVANPKRYIIIK